MSREYVTSEVFPSDYVISLSEFETSVMRMCIPSGGGSVERSNARAISLGAAVVLFMASLFSAVPVLYQLLIWRRPTRSCFYTSHESVGTEWQSGSIRGELSLIPFRLECTYLELDRVTRAVFFVDSGMTVQLVLAIAAPIGIIAIGAANLWTWMREDETRH